LDMFFLTLSPSRWCKDGDAASLPTTFEGDHTFRARQVNLSGCCLRSPVLIVRSGFRQSHKPRRAGKPRLTAKLATCRESRLPCGNLNCHNPTRLRKRSPKSLAGDVLEPDPVQADAGRVGGLVADPDGNGIRACGQCDVAGDQVGHGLVRGRRGRPARGPGCGLLGLYRRNTWSIEGNPVGFRAGQGTDADASVRIPDATLRDGNPPFRSASSCSLSRCRGFSP